MSGLQIARSYNAIGNLEKADKQYEGVVRHYSGMEVAQYEWGTLLIKFNKSAKAKMLFLELIQKNSSNPEYYYQLGKAVEKIEGTEKSLPYHKNAVTIDSTHLRSIFQIGKYYVKKRNKDSVLYYVDKGLAFYPEDVSLINLKALAYFNNKEFPKCIPYFEQLLALGEHKKYMYMKLAYAYFRTWEFEPSKKAYKTAIQMNGNDNDGEAFFELAQVFRKNREIDSAQYYLKKSIEVQKPNFFRQYEGLAQTYRVQGNLSQSLYYYTLAHKEAPDEARVFYQICAVKEQIKKDTKASLSCYEDFLANYKDEPYLPQIVAKRIRELKIQMHLEKE